MPKAKIENFKRLLPLDSSQVVPHFKNGTVDIMALRSALENSAEDKQIVPRSISRILNSMLEGEVTAVPIDSFVAQPLLWLQFISEQSILRGSSEQSVAALVNTLIISIYGQEVLLKIIAAVEGELRQEKTLDQWKEVIVQWRKSTTSPLLFKTMVINSSMPKEFKNLINASLNQAGDVISYLFRSQGKPFTSKIYPTLSVLFENKKIEGLAELLNNARTIEIRRQDHIGPAHLAVIKLLFPEQFE